MFAPRVLIVLFVLYSLCMTALISSLFVISHPPESRRIGSPTRISRIPSKGRCVRGWISQWNGYRWDCCESGERSAISTHPITYQSVEEHVPFHRPDHMVYDTSRYLTACKYATSSGVFCLVPSQCASRVCRVSKCE